MGFWPKIRKIKQEEGGSVAIEFAILAIPFFMLFIGIIEVCLCYFFENTLVRGMEIAVREVRVGQNFNPVKFQQKLCEAASVIPDCTTSVKVRLIQTTSFTPINALNICDQAGNSAGADVSGNIQASEAIVTAVACFKWKLFTPLMSKFLETYPDGTRVLSTAAGFRIEPFDQGSTP